MFTFGTFKPGSLSQAEADKLNWMQGVCEALQRLSVVAPLTIARGPDGTPVLGFNGSSTPWVIKGKLDGTLSFGGAAVMSVWEYNGSVEADTLQDVDVYDWLLLSGQTVAAGRQVVAVWAHDRYYVVAAQCES